MRSGSDKKILFLFLFLSFISFNFHKPVFADACPWVRLEEIQTLQEISDAFKKKDAYSRDLYPRKVIAGHPDQSHLFLLSFMSAIWDVKNKKLTHLPFACHGTSGGKLDRFQISPNGNSIYLSSTETNGSKPPLSTHHGLLVYFDSNDEPHSISSIHHTNGPVSFIGNQIFLSETPEGEAINADRGWHKTPKKPAVRLTVLGNGQIQETPLEKNESASMGSVFDPTFHPQFNLEYQENQIRLSNRENNQILFQTELSSQVTQVRFSPNQDLAVISGKNNMTYLLHIPTRRLCSLFEYNALSRNREAAFLDSGKMLASWVSDEHGFLDQISVFSVNPVEKL